MKYNTRDGKPLADDAVLSSFSKGVGVVVKDQSNVLYTILSGILEYFTGVYAFLTRSFLRIRLGERTFGIITILSVYFLVWLISCYHEIYDEAVQNFLSKNGIVSIWDKMFIFLTSFVALPMELFEKGSKFSFIKFYLSGELRLFIILIIVIGISQLADCYSRRFRGDIVHSYYRGDSLLFGWLSGKKVLGYTIDKKAVWMVVEPIFVLLISFIIEAFLKLEALAFILRVSAFCLFIEEYRVSSQTRKLYLDIVDGRLDAAYVSGLQKSYEQSLLAANKESPRETNSSPGPRKGNTKTHQGSDSPFRAKIC